jgi:hypothetical protein
VSASRVVWDQIVVVFLRADGVVAYRELMNVMNLLRQAGYLKIALVASWQPTKDSVEQNAERPRMAQSRSEGRGVFTIVL